MVNTLMTLNLVYVLNLTHFLKTISSRILFCAVEVLFAIQDGLHRIHEINITFN